MKKILPVIIIALVIILVLVFKKPGSVKVALGEYCYAQKTESMIKTPEGGQSYDYAFLRFTNDENGVSGTVETYPYATDASHGTISGMISTNENGTNIMKGLYYWNGEGMTGTDEAYIELLDDKARFGYGPTELQDDGVYHFTQGITGFREIAKVTCDNYDTLHAEYENKY